MKKKNNILYICYESFKEKEIVMYFLIKSKEYKIYFILVVFFIVEIFVIMSQGSNLYLGDFNLMNNDDVKYIRSAWTLVEEGRFVYHDVNEPTVFIMPGYTIILSFFILVFGKFTGIIALRVFQCILQVIALYLLYSISKKVFNNKVAWIAVILNMIYIPEIITPGLILTETVFKFLLILLVYISLKGLESRRMIFYFLGGIVWSLGMLMRPTIALYPIVILIMMIIYKYSLKEIVLRCILVLSVFIIIFTPWWVRNYTVFKRFIPFTLSSGNPFLQGTYINYDQNKDFLGYTPSNSAIEKDKVEMETGITRLKNHFPNNKLEYILWYTIGKTIYYWECPFYYYNLMNFHFSTFIISIIYHIVLIFLALISIFLMRYYRGKDIILIISVILYFNIVYLPYFTCSRYAYPTMSFIIILASHVLYISFSKLKNTVNIKQKAPR